MPSDRTPIGDEMAEKLPGHDIPQQAGDVPAPESVPPTNNPDPQPGDPKPGAPEGDEPGRPSVPVELPGRPHAPERVDPLRPLPARSDAAGRGSAAAAGRRTGGPETVSRNPGSLASRPR